MVSPPKIGDVVKIRAWHGVVLDVFKGETGKTILRVQTVRNVFRRLNPEFIEYDLAPDTITLARAEDLETEIERYKEVLDTSLHELLDSTVKAATE